MVQKLCLFMTVIVSSNFLFHPAASDITAITVSATTPTKRTPPHLPPGCIPSEFFVGNFVSNPTVDAQINMVNLAKAQNTALEALGENATISISVVPPTSAVTNAKHKKPSPALFHYVEMTASSPIPDLDLYFTLGVKNTTIFGPDVLEYVVTVQRADLVLNGTLHNAQPVILTLKFSNRSCRGGLIAERTFPSHVQGRRFYGTRLPVV